MENAQELIQRLNHSGKKLSKSHRRIAECIVTHYDKVVFMTASRLGEYVGVSESTVVRFATALGYEGYAEFQNALQLELKYRLTALERFELLSELPNDRDMLDNMAAADARNIRKNASLNELDALKNLCARLTLASKVYIWGQGHASAAAIYLASYLMKIMKFP